MEKEVMTENKEKFYVFSGIEHNLTGTDYLNRYYGAAGVDYGYVFANKHCMSALNKLLESLEEKYDTTLVITSGKRENPNYCVEYLKYNEKRRKINEELQKFLIKNDK